MSKAKTTEEIAELLRRTALRDFVPQNSSDGSPTPTGYRVTISPSDAPIPVLVRYALELIGLEWAGPVEKVAWWVCFTYKGADCMLAHQKFGLRLSTTHTDQAAAGVMLNEIAKKLIAAVRLVEPALTMAAPAILNAGDATVVNQHRRLRQAYDYHRDRALNPDLVEDEMSQGQTEGLGKWFSFKSGSAVMNLNASHDLIAGMSAYLSALEHDLVLALAFCGFNPAEDSLTELIGARWGSKWDRVVGRSDQEGVRLRQRLIDAVERWRNTYSHGGFEKGHGATIYLHTPGVAALPIGLTSVRDSPVFSFGSTSDAQREDVFRLFDEIDVWLRTAIPYAMQWIESGLDVRYDEEFRNMVEAASASPELFTELIDRFEYEQARVDNMDY